MTLLFVATIFYYKKYSSTKKQLEYEVNDIRNMARPSSEMADFNAKNNKYTNLAMETPNI